MVKEMSNKTKHNKNRIEAANAKSEGSNTIRNINHVTLTSGNIMQYKDDSVVAQKTKTFIYDMALKAIENGTVDVIDGVKLECVVDLKEKIYMATMFVDEPLYLPLIETSGAVDRQGGKFLWTLMKDLHKKASKEEASILCPETPFICDIIYPSGIHRVDVFIWSGDFTKCFGIEMLKILSGCK